MYSSPDVTSDNTYSAYAKLSVKLKHGRGKTQSKKLTPQLSSYPNAKLSLAYLVLPLLNRWPTYWDRLSCDHKNRVLRHEDGVRDMQVFTEIVQIRETIAMMDQASVDAIFLTLLLVVTNLVITKRCGKCLKPLHMGTHLRVLSESYPMNTNMTGFRWFSKIFAFLSFGRK